MKPRMTLAKFALVSASTMLLTACVSSQMPTIAPNDSSDDQATACDLEAIQHAIGEPFDEAKVSQLQSDSRARQVRVLRPGDAATMDHRPDRLNIHLDDQDVIEDLRCG